MEKFIPAQKLSKRQKRTLNNLRRATWGGINPVTRKPANPKAYNRKKSRKIGDEPDFRDFILRAG